MSSKNERKTEDIVRKKLNKLGYDDDENIKIEPQKSDNPKIQKLLKSASKSGEGIGKPEFIIRHEIYPDFLIVVECKPDIKFHQSENLDNPKDYAVDGVLHYASFLSKDYNVIAYAVSGETTSELEISSYFWVKESQTYSKLITDKNKDVEDFYDFEKLISYATFDHKLITKRFEDLISFSKDLHNYIRDYAKLSETEKPLLVSGVLIALLNQGFAKSYKNYNQKTQLAKKLIDAIEEVIDEAVIPKGKKKTMLQPFSFINVHPELSKVDSRTLETPLYKLICDIDIHVKPFIDIYKNFDVIGQFYGEFLRYTGGDKKGLGIVLTPKHVTEIFAKIANLTTKSVVLDICAGTGGFLISAMETMIRNAKTESQILKIKNQNLIGVEQQPNMYALACANMILRGDGKANLYQSSCFDEAITKEIKRRKADVGMINPPYSQKGDGLHELNFVEQMLDNLKKNSIGIAVVPMSCAISPHNLKNKILRKHRLDAVMSLPDEIFYPIGIVTCIMVFTSHIPHEQNPYFKTWFGYWKDDGFIKTKHKGRIDSGKWKKIEEKWLDSYFNRNEIPGLSVLKKVNMNDEWCAEAYMETDYNDIKKSDFEKSVKDYFIFKSVNNL
ncbi:MAG: N-6 DNA methylase [Ignavibacteria bacterium]|jgi:type I restriction-modification system DNA methylase subunit